MLIAEPSLNLFDHHLLTDGGAMTSINQSVVLTQRIDAALVEAQTPCGAIIRPMPCARRFPPPWMIQEHAESFIVRDATRLESGQNCSDNHFR